MEWPSKSPDCDLTENDKDNLGQAVQARINQPCNLRQLAAALQEEWARITQYEIWRLISRMRRRCQAVIQTGGGHTSYWLCICCNLNASDSFLNEIVVVHYAFGNSKIGGTIVFVTTTVDKFQFFK